MSLPAFSEAAMNQYLSSISNQPQQLQAFANALEANFLAALTARFQMDQNSIDSINAWPAYLKSGLVQTAKLAAFYSTFPDIRLPIEVSVEGFEDPGNQNLPADDVKLSWDVSLKAGGTYPNLYIDFKAKVTAEWYIC